ncbi:MAG: VOC family protein [Gammaproteobacteria bacterium]|nr:VOC family protein [Gammaproteobacteria bacterium]
MKIENSFWAACGVKTIDHVAVTTRNLSMVLKDYLGVPGSELLRGPGTNTSQNVDYAFVRLATGMVVEILGLKENSPITEHVENGGGAYHLCFTVTDMDHASAVAQDNGAIQVVKPREDDAFDGRRVAFFMHPDHGLFEFLDAYPKELSHGVAGYVSARASKKNKIEENIDSVQIIKQAFNKIFPELINDYDLQTAEYDVTPGWTSFKHLQLFMEIEQIAGVSFTADEIADIQSFNGLVNGLARKLEE